MLIVREPTAALGAPGRRAGPIGGGLESGHKTHILCTLAREKL
jgi:hypothetical protein